MSNETKNVIQEIKNVVNAFNEKLDRCIEATTQLAMSVDVLRKATKKRFDILFADQILLSRNMVSRGTDPEEIQKLMRAQLALVNDLFPL